jgi:hypothetical protein
MAREARVDLDTDNIRPAEKPRTQTWHYEKMACFIGHLFTVVDVHGKVHGCCTCQNELGSLGGSSFREVWSSRPYRLYRKILREMPTTGLTPPQCECRHGCGHIPENVRIQNELGFTFPARLPETEFATREDAAYAVCRALDAALPAMERGFEFADVDRDLADVASRLRQTGVMGGIGSMDGVSLFEPRRLLARREFDAILARALAAAGVETQAAEDILAGARTGSGHPAEPLGRHDMNAWLSAVAVELSRSR